MSFSCFLESWMIVFVTQIVKTGLMINYFNVLNHTYEIFLSLFCMFEKLFCPFRYCAALSS